MYINRTLQTNDNVPILESDIKLLKVVTVVCADPGAGKSELLNNWANRYSTTVYKASSVKYLTTIKPSSLIILDGLDEVTKVGIETVKEVLAHLIQFMPVGIIIACRASEWDERYTQFLKDIWNLNIVELQLLPFNQEEQKRFIYSKYPKICFDDFMNSTDKYDLSPLLNNPLLLVIFAESYQLNKGEFISKTKAFEDAIKKMASEHNPLAPTEHRPTNLDLIQYIEQIFTVLLLSGSSGIATKDTKVTPDYPGLYSLLDKSKLQLRYSIDTKLFTANNESYLFEPIHRVIAEYCCARYLVKRIQSQKDQLTLIQSLSIIAPDNSIRDDLRGVLGWMCAMGNQYIQTSLITLDPYSVLAYGDPKQLTYSSKQQLLKELKALSIRDPLFRRADKFRTFNVEGFFTDDIIEYTNGLLIDTEVSQELKGLILELIQNSTTIDNYKVALSSIILSSTASKSNRIMAAQVISKNMSYEAHNIVESLMNGKNIDNNAIEIAALLVKSVGVKAYKKELVSQLLLSFNFLYKSEANQDETYRSRYFIKSLISTFDYKESTYFLDELTRNLTCTCKLEPYDCYCREGVSKTVGKLLDRLFELMTEIPTASRILPWIKNLHFHNPVRKEDSFSTTFLQNNSDIRQEIQELYLMSVKDPERLGNKFYTLRSNDMHSGIYPIYQDLLNLSLHAFKQDNLYLWRELYPGLPNSRNEFIDAHRKLMRLHANVKSKFMSMWCELEQNSRRVRTNIKAKHYKRLRKLRRREKRKLDKNIIYFNDNIMDIKSGKHWGWITNFSQIVLRNNYQKFEAIIRDKFIPQESLVNCLSFIRPKIPTMSEFITMKKERYYAPIISVLYATCMSIYRKNGNLSLLTNDELKLLYFANDWNYDGLSDQERDFIQEKIKLRIFKERTDYVNYAKETLEPFFDGKSQCFVNTNWLKTIPKEYELQCELITGWLEKYPMMNISELDYFFYTLLTGEKNDFLRALVIKNTERYCSLLNENNKLGEEVLGKITFWFIRYYHFIPEENEQVSSFLTRSAKEVFKFIGIYDDLRGDTTSSWPKLTAEKVFTLLDAFVPHWPKVYLPGSWGSHSPDTEKAYRFLSNFVWRIADDKVIETIKVADKILKDNKFKDYKRIVLHLKATANRKTYRIAPIATDVLPMLNVSRVATVQHLKALILEALEQLQVWLKGAETDPLDPYYNLDTRVDENTARNRIVEDLHQFISKFNLDTNIEKHMAHGKRCDITYQSTVGDRKNLLVIEVKGQWNTEIFTNTKTQLYDRYSHHPYADFQGIYLALWFGQEVKVCNRKLHSITTAEELKENIIETMPDEINKNIDVFVLDLSR